MKSPDRCQPLFGRLPGARIKFVTNTRMATIRPVPRKPADTLLDYLISRTKRGNVGYENGNCSVNPVAGRFRPTICCEK